MVANLSGDIAFQQNEDQWKTHYRGGHSIGLAMMIFDCSASAATCVKFISIRSSDFLINPSNADLLISPSAAYVVITYD